jgi:ribonuclease BN (tRNA processing enzyme)
VRITVLGKSPSWQDADGACSGYLVEEGDLRLLVECGNGVFAKLRRFADWAAIDAVVVSHLHADHFLDLIPYSYALTYAPLPRRAARPALHAPPDARATFRRVVGAWGDERLIEGAFDLREYAPGRTLELGPLRLRFQAVPHYVPAWAIDIAGPAGRCTFGADCAPNDEIVRFAAGTDLFFVEASIPEPERDGMRGHLTPAEAGEHGARAGAERLVVTHFPEELDVRTPAEAAFGGPVELAREGAVYTV